MYSSKQSFGQWRSPGLDTTSSRDDCYAVEGAGKHPVIPVSVVPKVGVEIAGNIRQS